MGIENETSITIKPAVRSVSDMWISHILDDLYIATTRLVQCLNNRSLDPSSDVEWVMRNLDGLRKQLIGGKSTAQLQVEQANKVKPDYVME